MMKPILTVVHVYDKKKGEWVPKKKIKKKSKDNI